VKNGWPVTLALACGSAYAADSDAQRAVLDK